MNKKEKTEIRAYCREHLWSMRLAIEKAKRRIKGILIEIYLATLYLVIMIFVCGLLSFLQNLGK
jgi:hypothetical protein